MNTDSRFCKNLEFVFYYLWQKELHELSSGIYNVLKSSSRKSHMVKQFVDGISSADAGIEANLPPYWSTSEVPNSFGSIKRVMFWQ